VKFLANKRRVAAAVLFWQCEFYVKMPEKT
jgi:hypothetical protein